LNHSPLSIGSSSVLALISLLESYGFEQPAITKHSGINLSHLDHQDSRLSLKEYHCLWKTALQLTNRPALGLELGLVLNNSKIGLVGHVVLNSESFSEGIDEYSRFFSIVNEAISLTIEKGHECTALRFIHIDPEYYCIPDMERTMTLFLHRSRAMFGKKIQWESVSFQHSEPSYLKQYKKIFNCPINFNKNYCEIVVKNEYLLLKPAQSNHYIGSAAKQYANNLLKKLSRKTYSDKVKLLISQNIGTDKVDVDHIAELLHTSRQTLYRKLKAENVSYQSLLEEVRYASAIKQLQDKDLSLGEIAFSLGFSDLSAFSRAFKRWSGSTPKSFRNN